MALEDWNVVLEGVHNLKGVELEDRVKVFCENIKRGVDRKKPTEIIARFEDGDSDKISIRRIYAPRRLKMVKLETDTNGNGNPSYELYCNKSDRIWININGVRYSILKEVKKV